MGNDDIEIKGTYIAVNDDFIHISQGGYDSIKIAREDIKVLVQAEKSLKLQVKKLMVDHGLDAINLKKGKISVRKSSRKTGLNKTTVKEGLVNYFNGNEQQAESVLKAILDSLPVKESTSLSLTGIKDKK